jgi:hypothetical protein
MHNSLHDLYRRMFVVEMFVRLGLALLLSLSLALLLAWGWDSSDHNAPANGEELTAATDAKAATN